MSKIEGLDPQGIAAWVHGLDRPALAQSVADQEDDSSSRVEEIAEPSDDTSDLSKSGHAFARASEQLKSVGYRHREHDSDSQDPADDASQTSDDAEASSEGLTAAEEKQVRELKDTDNRVRAHEMAHKAAAGALAAGGPYYDLQQGPDGQNYAVGGEVPIRLPETNDYKQAIKDAQQAERAALAPADPSPDDYAAAAAFRQRALEARAKLSDEERAQPSKTDEPTSKAKGDAMGAFKSPTPQEKDGPRTEHKNGTHSVDNGPERQGLQPVSASFVTSSAVDSDSPA